VFAPVFLRHPSVLGQWFHKTFPARQRNPIVACHCLFFAWPSNLYIEFEVGKPVEISGVIV